VCVCVCVSGGGEHARAFDFVHVSTFTAATIAVRFLTCSPQFCTHDCAGFLRVYKDAGLPPLSLRLDPRPPYIRHSLVIWRHHHDLFNFCFH
jgi:hypothetical protein